MSKIRGKDKSNFPWPNQIDLIWFDFLNFQLNLLLEKLNKKILNISQNSISILKLGIIRKLTKTFLKYKPDITSLVLFVSNINFSNIIWVW